MWDLVPALRQNARYLRSGGSRLPPEGKQFDILMDEAADEIERLRKKLDDAEAEMDAYAGDLKEADSR